MPPTNVSLNLNLLRLLQLASSTLPVGAYSYSEGIETLVQLDKINSAEGLEHWLRQELSYGAVRLEAAVMLRSYRSLSHFDSLIYWNHWLSATRDTEELRSQSWQMGRSLLQLFQNLQPGSVPHPLLADPCNFAIAFGIVAATWEIDERSALLGYLHSWANNLISAGIKLIPLGQTAGQKLLLSLSEVIDRSSQEILTIADDDLATCGWGLSLASMAHETLYSRLFRS
ncbi:MAG: urease accessory protein UreF [Leptolyngbyaceae cyanobacterium CSU_1_3]|nr:urease accessory protein UreF [Leptolyngbyaceae cyanobacterium CSU_1_3]